MEMENPSAIRLNAKPRLRSNQRETMLTVFNMSEILVRFLDRLHYPNEDATWEQVTPVVSEVVSRKLGGVLELTRDGDEKAPLSVRVLRLT